MNFFYACPADNNYEEPLIYENPEPDQIWVIPLGGLGEIGKNMMALESRDDIIIIDAGMMFPREDMPGVDYVIPDIRYLLHKQDKIRGIVLTHGHEDHIGAVPYIISRLDAPLYGTSLTLEFVQCKLDEFGLAPLSMTKMKAHDRMTLGAFEIEFIPVTHSISDSMGLLIHTPAGSIFHSGDFKLEPESESQGLFPEELSRGGVRLLMSDSTYAERPGFSIPEREVGKALDMVFSGCDGRIIISTFASSIPRLQMIMEKAGKYGRSVCIHGKGLETSLAIAQELGYFQLPPSMIIRREDMKSIPDRSLLVLATGSQGEPFSALSLMATNNHKWVKIKEGDTVIISATPVPGNETLVHSTINSLFRLGANVIYDLPFKSGGGKMQDFHIHVSGHGSSEELKLLIKMVKPEMFMPIHGEIRHLIHHSRLAREMGIPAESIFYIQDGDILEISPEGGRLLGRLCLENIYVDGLGVGDVGRAVIRDRQAMSQGGICFAVVTIDENTGELLSGPHIETRGLVYEPESHELLEAAITAVSSSIPRDCSDREATAACIKTALRRFFQGKIRRRPIIIPMVITI